MSKKFDDGVFIVFMVLENDKLCGGGDGKAGLETDRKKNFTFQISDTLSKKRIQTEIAVTIVGKES